MNFDVLLSEGGGVDSIAKKHVALCLVGLLEEKGVITKEEWEDAYARFRAGIADMIKDELWVNTKSRNI
jgi:hypothetical protein